MKLAAGRQAVFHRAFDVVPEPLTALDQLIELGLTRVMTSGQETSAYNGAANIALYLQHSAGRIEILRPARRFLSAARSSRRRMNSR